MKWNLTLAILPSLEEDHISFFKKQMDFPFPPDEFKLEFIPEHTAKIKKNDCVLKINGEFDIFLKYHYTDNKADEKSLQFLSHEEVLAYNNSLKQVYSFDEFIGKIKNEGWQKWEAKKFNL